ncbi:MAG: hypothetical protein RQ899_07560 [Pseudomonadales bacterium]|nr:hypothetical protein [Pseudomonadales bacterium]
MASYLALPSADRVDSLNGEFDPARFFCLIGTNHKDYNAVRFAVGPMSDGLVKIENAAVQGAPRAYVYRSHSGHYGLVNSEEGYQNLVRFLFGDTFVAGILELQDLPLPPRIRREYEAGKQIRVSYLFESTVTPRGAFDVNLTERRIDDASAIFRTFDELFDENGQHPEARSPQLFSVFLDSKKIEHGKTLVFTLVLAVRTTDYLVGKGPFQQRIPGEVLLDTRVTLRATMADQHWRLRYVMASEDWSENEGREMAYVDGGAIMDLSSKKGCRARLHLKVSPWNRE